MDKPVFLDLYVGGSFNGGRHHIGLIRYEALRGLFDSLDQFADLLFESVLTPPQSKSVLFSNASAKDIFFLVPSPMLLEDEKRGRFARACIFANTQNALDGKKPHPHGSIGLREDESFFTAWVELVRSEQFYIWNDINAHIMFAVKEVISQHSELKPLIRSFLDELIVKPLMDNYALQRPIYSLMAALLAELQKTPALYEYDLSLAMPMRLEPQYLEAYERASNLYKLILSYDKNLRHLSLKDLSGLVAVNRLILNNGSATSVAFGNSAVEEGTRLFMGSYSSASSSSSSYLM